MIITDRGEFIFGRIDERGRIVSNNLTETGQFVFTVSEGGVSGTPNVSIVSISHSKISDESGMSQAIITIQFDKPVTQYVAMLNGVNYQTGTNVHTGGSVAANTNAQVIVDWNEGLSEGQNRINIYGKGTDGTWTAYQN